MLTDGRGTDDGVTGLLLAHPSALGSGELKSIIKFKLHKSDKNNLRITSKSHAHLQSLPKTPAKFQKDPKNCRRSVYMHW